VIAVTLHSDALARRLAAIFATLAKRRLHRQRRLMPARVHILPPRRPIEIRTYGIASFETRPASPGHSSG
jgi:hypothetical protein